MVALRGAYLAIPLLILSWSIMPILGLQNSSRNILSEGTVIYPESQLGVWYVASDSIIPSEANRVFARFPEYGTPNLLENLGFEVDFLGWDLYTPSDKTPMRLDIMSGYDGNSAVITNDELGYSGGLRQALTNMPSSVTLHFNARVKTTDVEDLYIYPVHYSVYDGVDVTNGHANMVTGSTDWTLYEIEIEVPSNVVYVRIYPVLVYNRGEVWVDEVSLAIEGWQPPETPAILDWYELHYPSKFVTEADIEFVERGLKTVPIENFQGIVGPVTEEHYRIHVGFNDDVNTAYFGENLLGYPLYLAESPDATVDQWKDEMYLRMIRGFHNYFSPLTKVGITAGRGSIVEYWQGVGPRGVPYYFGEPAMDFIREHYDFVVLYTYTEKYEDFINWTKQYFETVDQLFTNQEKFWILTPIWRQISPPWQTEILALEMKNCFDRNIEVTYYYDHDPQFMETWALMKKAIELYDAKAPYYETIVYGENLLTGDVGDTYGWVEVTG